MAQGVTTAVTVAVDASPSPTPVISPASTAAVPIAKPSIIYDDDKNSATITIAATATDSDDDPDIEFLSNALQCHLSFNIAKADSPSLSSDLRSSSTFSSVESMYSTISSVLSSSKTTSKMPSYMGLDSSRSHTTTPFSMAGFVKKIAKPGLARKVSLAEFQKQQVFLEFRTWSDESSDTEDEDEDDGEAQLDEEEEAARDGRTGDEDRPKITSGQSAVLLRRLKKRVERDTLKAPRPVLARVDTASSANSMITVMSASVDATDSCNSSEKAQLLNKIEALTKELNEARAGYVELKNRYKILAARYDEGHRENELLRSRISDHEAKIESRGPPGPAIPPGLPTPVMSNAHVPGAKPNGPLLKSTQGVPSSGRPYPAASAATPKPQALSKPAAISKAPNKYLPNSKVYELCGALAYSNNALRKGLAMTPGAGVVNIPNMLEKTMERPGYRFEPNSVTIICCSKNHDAPTIRSDIFTLFRDKASSSPLTKVSRDTKVSQKPLCIMNCVNDRAASAVFEALSVHPSYQTFTLILS
ncbi:hypothetical protein V1505DRAFT_355551 [Lipomyces doorenjongii]